MIGIQDIGVYIPKRRDSNYKKTDKFDIQDSFIEGKIGFKELSVKELDEDCSSLCLKAFDNLNKKTEVNLDEVGLIVVVTQNPDYNLPHTAAIVHGKLDMKSDCASFDISLGCSGFVYALSVVESFMSSNSISNALLFTSDPYSKIVRSDDKSTSLLFGDGSTATLISKKPKLISGKFTFGTIGQRYEDLICKQGELFMDGRSIFEFAARYVPKDFKNLLAINEVAADSVDVVLMHQGSKYIIDTLAKKLGLPSEKIPFLAGSYGNTVSSSIPIMLEGYLNDDDYNLISVTGFGVGLSWSSTLLKRL